MQRHQIHMFIGLSHQTLQLRLRLEVRNHSIDFPTGFFHMQRIHWFERCHVKKFLHASLRQHLISLCYSLRTVLVDHRLNVDYFTHELYFLGFEHI